MAFVDAGYGAPAAYGAAAYGGGYQSLPMEAGGVTVGAPFPFAQDANASFLSQGAGRLVNEHAVVGGYEHVKLRVPARAEVRTVFVPGPVLNQVVQAPPREVVRTMRVQGPAQIQKVSVQGPPREVVRRVAVQGPERVVTRQVSVQGPPREVVRREAVQGPPREVVKRVEVQGPPREVVRRVEIPGPPREQVQTVQVAVPGPPREVVRKVAVPRDIVRQVVKHVDVDQWVDQPVPVQGPGAVRVRFIVDQPPRFVPVPQPVFRTQLVPTVVLVPFTQQGVVPVPQAIPQPPRMFDGPVVPEQAFPQQMAPQGFSATMGGFGAPAPAFDGGFASRSLGGFAPPAEYGQSFVGGAEYAAPTFGAPVATTF